MAIYRSVLGSDGARGKKHVWRPHVRTYGFKYSRHCWYFSAPSDLSTLLQVEQGIVPPLPYSVRPWPMAMGEVLNMLARDKLLVLEAEWTTASANNDRR